MRGTLGWRGLADTSASVAVVIFCLAATWNILARPATLLPIQATRSPSPASPSALAALPTAPVSLDGAELKGDPSAQIVVIEYSDFQCPYCATFARDTLPELLKAYVNTGKVRLAFRHLPLPSLHPFAPTLAAAAVCAGEQGAFWRMHDSLFEDSKSFNEAKLIATVSALGMDLPAFNACRSRRGAKQVQDDIESATLLGIRGTPTLLIGRILPNGMVNVSSRLSGAASFERFRREVDRLLAQNGRP